MIHKGEALWRLSLHKVSKIPTKSCTIYSWNIFFISVKNKSAFQPFVLQTGMSWCSLSPIFPATSPASQMALARGWVLGSQHCRGRRHIPHLPGILCVEQLCQICVPVRLFFPAPAPLRAVPLSCTLPTLFESRDISRVSQKQSVTKGNLTPWQPQGRFSELLQQLWSGLEAIWFCRGWMEFRLSY